MAIFLVVAVHAGVLARPFGFIGVDMFFVLSGFLITCLLLEEWKTRQRISLQAFYARRALRLLPALFALLIAAIIYSGIVESRRNFILELKHVLAALFYCMNWVAIYSRENILLLRHTWSLSVEEQFYLVWPLLLLLLLRRTTPESLFYLLLLATFCSAMDRFLLFAGTPVDWIRLVCGLDTRADALLLGCAVAVSVSYGLLPRSPWLATALRCGSVVSVMGLGLIGFCFQPDKPGMYCGGWLVVSLLAASIILQLVAAPGTPIQRGLELPAVVYLGKISYGLYLWHWPLIYVFSECPWPAWKTAPLCAVTIVSVTLASFYLLERPCLRLKTRFQKVRRNTANWKSAL